MNLKSDVEIIQCFHSYVKSFKMELLALTHEIVIIKHKLPKYLMVILQ
jgi:hypothetical protein